MNEIAVLITVHNRKEKTLKCLQKLFEQQEDPRFRWDVFVTDDGCTDGTADAIRTHYPKVNIIKGNGQLYWNRGMYKAWESAANNEDYDYYLWLNDDTMLYDNAIKTMYDAAHETSEEAIICGATLSTETKDVSYSGHMRNNFQNIAPNGKLQYCEIINGNFLLISKKIFRQIGNLDWTFKHAIGDFDYGLRAKAAGFNSYIAPQYIGTCEQNPSLPGWCLPSTPLRKRFKLLYSPLGYAEPISFFIYEKRHFGLSLALKHFLSINLRALIPQLWK